MFTKLNQSIQSTTIESEANLNQLIEELEQKLNHLREEAAKNKDRQQKQATLLGSMQSALVQIAKAVAAAEGIEESEMLGAFWEEVEDIKAGNVSIEEMAALPTDDDESEEPEAALPAPNDTPPQPGDATVDAEVSTIAENSISQTATRIDPLSEIDSLTPDEIVALSRADLTRLTHLLKRERGVSVKGSISRLKKPELIAHILSYRNKH